MITMRVGQDVDEFSVKGIWQSCLEVVIWVTHERFINYC